MLDEAGEERHRVEGFLPAADFISQLALGRAKAAFASGDFAEAERRFREVVDRYPNADAAAEALYWAGVSHYKATNDHTVLGKVAEELRSRHPSSVWASKAIPWLH